MQYNANGAMVSEMMKPFAETVRGIMVRTPEISATTMPGSNYLTSVRL